MAQSGAQARKSSPEAEIQPEETMPIPLVTPYVDTRKKVSGVLKDIGRMYGLESSNILDGTEDKIYSHSIKSGDGITAFTDRGGLNINNNRIFVDPSNSRFALIHGGSDVLDGRYGAEIYAKNFNKTPNFLQAVRNSMVEIRNQKLRADVSYAHLKIIKDEEGKKYIALNEAGENIAFFVYDSSGSDKTNPDSRGRIFVDKGDRVVVFNKDMGFSPDNIFQMMIRKNGKFRKAKELIEILQSETKDKKINRAFAVIDIK